MTIRNRNLAAWFTLCKISRHKISNFCHCETDLTFIFEYYSRIWRKLLFSFHYYKIRFKKFVLRTLIKRERVRVLVLVRGCAKYFSILGSSQVMSFLSSLGVAEIWPPPLLYCLSPLPLSRWLNMILRIRIHRKASSAWTLTIRQSLPVLLYITLLYCRGSWYSKGKCLSKFS